MIEIVWEYVVKKEAQGQFELAFGPGGAWSRLFAGYPGFRGTTLLRGMTDPRRYLAFDLWDSAAEHEEALSECEDEYADLEAAFDEWTESRAKVGAFRVLAQGTVRPRGRAARIEGAEARRRNRRTTR